MNAKEFEAWLARNVSRGGRPNSVDEYNRAFKKERPDSAEEYASRNVKEYHYYSETKGLNSEQDEDSNDQSKSDKNKQKSKQRSNSQLTRNLVSRFIGIAMGAMIVANGYQAMGGNLPFDLPITFFPAAEETPKPDDGGDDHGTGLLLANWVWSEDHMSATLRLTDDKGTLVKELPAAVNVVRTEPGCSTEGSAVYTASAEDGGDSYSDSYTEILPAQGHIFDGGTTSVSEDGKIVVIFECTHCHEQFTITTTVTENEP